MKGCLGAIKRLSWSSLRAACSACTGFGAGNQARCFPSQSGGRARTCIAMVPGRNAWPNPEVDDTATQVWLLRRSLPACTAMTIDWMAFATYPTGVPEYWNVPSFLLAHIEACGEACGQRGCEHCRHCGHKSTNRAAARCGPEQVRWPSQQAVLVRGGGCGRRAACTTARMGASGG
jgi:hypothetical protein